MRIISCLNIFLLITLGRTQYFDLEQVEQLYRPRLVCDAGWTGPSTYSDTNTTFTGFRTGVAGTIPVISRFGAELKPDLTSFKLKDIIKNSVRIRASQLLAGFRAGYGQVTPGITYPGTHGYGYASASLLGVHLDKRYRVVFYSLGVGISEQTFARPVPVYSAVVGRMHIRGIRRMYHYGVAILGSSGFPVPVPFIGGTFPVSKHWSFRTTLPVSMDIRYHNRKVTAGATIQLAGFRTGIQTDAGRLALTYAGLRYGGYIEQRLGRQVEVFASGGYTFPGRLITGNGVREPKPVTLQGGFYASAGVRMLFGRSLLGKLVTGIGTD